MASILFCVPCIQFLQIQRFFLAHNWSSRFINLCFFYFDLNAMTFFVLYDDAMNNIRKVQIRLEISMEATKYLNAFESLSLKRKIRYLIRKLNKQFALPLAMFYSQIVMAILFSFSRVVGARTTITESMNFILFQFFLILIHFCLAGKASSVAAHGAKVESILIMRSSGGLQVECANLLGVLRFREDWDVLRVACFPLRISNLLSFLACCITCVAVILQFDYKVARSLSRLSALP